MLRIFDFLLAFIAILILFPLLIFLYLVIYLENRSPFFYQKRIGRNMKEFTLIKFRTMSIGTKSCATHLLDNSRITKLGKILRKTKLDELPQLFNVLKGDGLVGQRPSIPTQFEVIDMRRKYGLYNYLPGITGLSQIRESICLTHNCFLKLI